MSVYLIMITHFVSDWILQPRHAAEKKTSNPLWMLFHVGAITACFFFSGLFRIVPDVPTQAYMMALFSACILNGLWHFFIDSVVWKLFACWVAKEEINDIHFVKHNKFFKTQEFYITVAFDQMAHLGIAFYLFGGLDAKLI